MEFIRTGKWGFMMEQRGRKRVHMDKKMGVYDEAGNGFILARKWRFMMSMSWRLGSQGQENGGLW